MVMNGSGNMVLKVMVMVTGHCKPYMDIFIGCSSPVGYCNWEHIPRRDVKNDLNWQHMF